MARGRRPNSDKRQWSFGWICSHCDGPRRFLVAELVGQISPVMARCESCTSLVTVRDVHRRASRDLSD